MGKFCRKIHLARSGKRWLAFLMSVCLIGTMIPITARAETAENIVSDETLSEQTESKLITAKPDRVVGSNILSDYNTSFEGANDAGNLWWWNDASWGQTDIPRRAYGEAAKPAADCGDYYVQANSANIGDKAQCQIAGEVLEKAPTDAGSYLAVFTFTSDGYEGTESYSFEITKAEITVAAKDWNIYTGDTVPDLANPVEGKDYTVTGLCGTDVCSGTALLSYR